MEEMRYEVMNLLSMPLAAVFSIPSFASASACEMKNCAKFPQAYKRRRNLMGAICFRSKNSKKKNRMNANK